MAAPIKILVVEDSEELRNLSRILIEDVCGFEAVIAASLTEVQRVATDALACCRALLDVNLGPMEPDGIAVCKWLRSQGFDKPVYFLTGHGHPQVKEQMAAGATPVKVFFKPVPTSDFIRIVKGEL